MLVQNREMEYFDKSTFRLAVEALKDTASKKGVVISDQEIMEKLKLVTEDYAIYMDEKQQAPDLLIHLLRERFSEYIATLRFEQIEHVVRVYPDDPPTPPVEGYREENENGI